MKAAIEVSQMAHIRGALSLRKWKQDGILFTGARLVLAGVFIYASIDKIIHPAAFAEAVYNYQILPHALINLAAIILPWLELTLGIFLMIGLFREGSAFIVTFLLLVFFGAMVFNLARGLDIYCGCFSTSQDETSRAPMAWYLFRDGLFLLPAFYLFFHTFRGKRQMVKV